ncbi:MAG: hypothetical protein M1821_003410 [Bathelium mastoideum]|nr:MAG: hypothetical protein M1821_003410 [Bathelium mastoideum]KAI9686034.1 MAG: hypothetical protein M1822_004017 [Bathelium mastoideum]
MHPPRMLTHQLHRIRTKFASNPSSRASSTTSKSPLSSSSSFVEPAAFPPTTSHSTSNNANEDTNHPTTTSTSTTAATATMMMVASPNLSATTEFSTGFSDLSATPSVASSINQAILLRRRPSSLELELAEERRMFGGRAPFFTEPRPTDRLDVGVVPMGGLDELMRGR